MKKSLLALTAAVAMLVVAAQSTTAKADSLFRRSPSVTAAQLTVGLASSATLYALTHRHHHHVRIGSRTFVKWYSLTTIGCMALTPIVGAALVGHYEHRELRSSEVFIMAGDCIVPILGGLFWQAMFDAHPEWDRGTGGPTRR